MILKGIQTPHANNIVGDTWYDKGIQTIQTTCKQYSGRYMILRGILRVYKPHANNIVGDTWYLRVYKPHSNNIVGDTWYLRVYKQTCMILKGIQNMQTI